MLDISAWFNDLLADNLIFTPTTLGYYWEGLVTTTQLVFLSLVAGLILAVPLAIMR
ncbi:MAG TPA: amino acid ABC transporter permease, partial [Halomonas sp.]|nr:amino acid ABC transporter permease [Halomonas sp.]HAY15548.1 amino acid ABC transporter permease [Halomonas sp.]HCL22317.1 amino acid ABC transporter permease [Halomonas sp.]